MGLFYYICNKYYIEDEEIISNKKINDTKDDKKRGLIVVDEFHSFIDEENPTLLKYFASLTRKLRKYSYMELLNEIVSKRVEQEIPKEHIKQFLIPEFYDAHKTESNDVYINSIFNYILEQLGERNNMYLVLIYFYPFITHDQEKSPEHFFNTIRFITQSHRLEISRENVRKWLFNYI